jgi:hypothetical protein
MTKYKIWIPIAIYPGEDHSGNDIIGVSHDRIPLWSVFFVNPLLNLPTRFGEDPFLEKPSSGG